MGISTSNSIGKNGITTSFDSNSSNTTKTKSDENIRDTFQDIMGLVNVDKNQSSDYSVKSDKSKTALSGNLTSNKTVSNSTTAYKKESQQYSTDSKVKSSDSSSVKSTASSDKKEVSDTSGADKSSGVKENTSAEKSVKSTASTGNDSASKAASDAENVQDVAADVVAQIMQSVADIMDISVEKLQQSMDELGLDVSDLLGDEGVKQLVLDIKNADNIDMLVDESLGQYMQQISESISDIVADFQNTDMTELTARQLSEPDIQDIDKKDDENTDKSAESVASDRSDTVTKDAGNSQTVELTDVNKTDDGIANEKRSILTEGEAQPGSTEEGNLNGQTGENTFSQEQSKQGNSLDGNLVNDIAQVLTEAVSQNGEISDFDGDVQAADIVRQVVDEIKTNINDKVRSLELSLNPESLGRVQITVTTKNGVMQARIIAENEAAKNAIEGSIALLKESFNEQNLKVEEVEVMIANYDFFKEDNEAQNNENKQKNTSSGGNTETGNDDIVREELSDAEQLEKDMMQQSGNSVSYTV